MGDGVGADVAASVLAGADGDIVQRSLAFVRLHLDMEVAYLSEFVGDDLVFRATDAPGFEDQVHVGGRMPLDAVYCRHILEGRLPELIPDTGNFPFAQTIPITAMVPIGSHVSIPIRRADGTPYGMFCCLSRSPKPTLNDRDLEVMRAFANISAEQVRSSLVARVRREDLQTRVTAALDGQLLTIVFQPIFDLATRGPVGFEALSRFKSEPYVPPNVWFGEADEVGLMPDLEILAIRRALERLTDIPDHLYLSVNASPATVETGRLLELFRGHDTARIVLEVTEHDMPKDLDAFVRNVSRLRKEGVRLAIDDMGAGYSGLQQVVALKPDIIKLDMSLVSGVHIDVVRRSLASALLNFAREIGALIVAEGIEDAAEVDSLAKLGIGFGQGYFLGRPDDLPHLAADAREQARA